jgi:hypothetical protein
MFASKIKRLQTGPNKDKTPGPGDYKIPAKDTRKT